MTTFEPNDEHPWIEDAEARAQALVTEAHHAVDRNASRWVGTLGAVMVTVGCGLMIAGVAFSFSLTVMVWGSILAALSLFVSHRAAHARLEALRIARTALEDVQDTRLRMWVVGQMLDGQERWSTADVHLALMRARPR
ncbi:MAG: hypothetical protein RIT81_25840 [Deltaproteobacteria bacterium]